MKPKNIINLKIFLAVFVFLMLTPSLAYAQSIPITISADMNHVIFDGKWTFVQEWKSTSLTEMQTEDAIIYIRTAHLENFLYVMIDAVADTSINNSDDTSTVCFNTLLDTNTTSNISYCFVLRLGDNTATTLIGSNTTTQFEIVNNHKDLIAIASASDQNDRYTKIPHGSYEFKIPLELLGRSDKYNFYASVFDFEKSKTYTWPPDVNSDSGIPSIQKWGLLYSPDKSLPEYEVPMLILILSILVAIFLSSKNRLSLSYYKR
jgi:hypothetical protein